MPGYSNSQVDQLLESARAEQDTAKRADLYNQANRIVMTDCPVAFLTWPDLVEGMSKKVQGYVFRDEFSGSYDESWLTQ
jgi:peptide/nickel transport system substrate-binding protein